MIPRSCRHPGVFYPSPGLSTFRDAVARGTSRHRFMCTEQGTLTVRRIPTENEAWGTDVAVLA